MDESPANSSSKTPVGLVLGLGITAAVVIIVVVIVVLRYRKSWTGFALARAVSTHLPPDLRGPTAIGDDVVQLTVEPTPGYAASNPLLSSRKSSTPQSPLSINESSFSDKLLKKSSAKMDFDFAVTAFTYEELALASDDFSDANLLGRGGFGYVHKGVLPDGREVAIKQLKLDSRQGEREFRAEVEIISRVHHKHLVSLVGYCVAGDQRMLVYEFVPNNTLDFQLHGKGRIPIDWPTRMKVALGSAKGLAYLLEDCQPKIIHRDIKATNILLDSNFEPKVADFGLAHFYMDTDTHVSTRIIGTFGYIAPEYAQFGQLTDKSDVFSFGVMLLELISGCRPTDKDEFSDDIFVERARPLLAQAVKDGNFDALVDPRLEKNYDSTEMARMIACASACIRRSARRRPRMSQIIRALEGNIPLEDLNDNTKLGSVTYGTEQSKEDQNKFRDLLFESQDPDSSGYSGPKSSIQQLSFSTSSASEGVTTIPYLG